jgi:cystathionine beta-lyase
MTYDFDRIIDRKDSASRKWSPQVINEEFGYSDGLLPMWIADMDFKCPPAVIEALEEVAKHGIYGYTYVTEEYYQAVVRWCGFKHNWDVKKEWITFTHGTVSTLHYIIQAFCEEGDKVIIQTPSYSPFKSAITRQSCVPCYNPLQLVQGKYEIDFDDLEQKASDPRAKMLLFCSPHNPTGRVWTLEELKLVSEICLRNNVLMVSDEIHRDVLLYGNKHIPLSEVSGNAADHCIICLSPNKAFNFGGLKSSYTVIPNEQIREVLEKQLAKNSITSPNVFAVPALIAAYTKSDCWLKELIQYVEGNFDFIRNFLKVNMPEVKLIEPEASYLAWLDFRQIQPEPIKLDDLMLHKAKIALNGGHSFVANGEGFVRMNVGCPRSYVEEAMHRIYRAVRQ